MKTRLVCGVLSYFFFSEAHLMVMMQLNLSTCCILAAAYISLTRKNQTSQQPHNFSAFCTSSTLYIFLSREYNQNGEFLLIVNSIEYY